MSISRPAHNRKADPEMIRKLAAQGKSRAEIAEQIGCHVSAISGVKIRHGITIIRAILPPVPPSPFWAESDARLEQLVKDGATTTEAGRALGVTKNSVISRAYRLGLIWARLPGGTVVKLSRAKHEFPPSGHCVFPIGHPGDAGFHFCGERTEALLRPYCEQHHRKCYRPAPVIAEAA